MFFLGRYHVPRDTTETLMSGGAIHGCLEEDALGVPAAPRGRAVAARPELLSGSSWNRAGLAA